MARVDKSQTGAKSGIAREREGVRGVPADEGDYRSRVGLDRDPDRRQRGVELGDGSAFDGRATNVAARRAGVAGALTARGTAFLDTLRGLFGGTRPTERPPEPAPRGRRLEEGAGVGEPGADLAAPSARPSAKPGPAMGKSTPGLGTTTRPVRAGERRGRGADDRAVESSAARGSAAKPVRESRGGDRARGDDRSAGGARAHRGGGGRGGASRGTTPPRSIDEGLDVGDRDERIDTREGSAPATKGRGQAASSGRSGSRRAAKATTRKKTHATRRGAASSGEQRGATLGPRKGTRSSGSESRGTSKSGTRRGSGKSARARRAR